MEEAMLSDQGVSLHGLERTPVHGWLFTREKNKQT